MNESVMTAGSSGVWLLLGIVIGTIIDLSATYLLKWRQTQKDKKNFKFEIKMNIKKVDTWISYVEKLRSDLSTDTIHNFYYYFDFSKTIYLIANSLANSGALYSVLTVENIEKLQDNISFLSVSIENTINKRILDRQNEVEAYKNMDVSEYQGRSYEVIKSEIVGNINYYEKKLNECKSNFEDILKNIK